MHVYAAFYKKKSSIWDAIIRWRTNSQYSHCELVLISDNINTKQDILDYVDYYSSSPRDNGVRKMQNTLKLSNWDLIPLPWINYQQVVDFYEVTKGAKYDWLGVLIGQGLSIKLNRSNAWFCSEWCAKAINLCKPWRYSPGLLFDVLTEINKINGR
jgi:hypothetical protein